MTTNDSLSICNGDSIQIGTNYYYNAGNYSDTLNTVNGCDSIVYTNLSVGNSSYVSQNVTICFGENYSVGSNLYSVSGNYIDTVTFGGCDSIIYTDLTVLNNSSYQQNLFKIMKYVFQISSKPRRPSEILKSDQIYIGDPLVFFAN